MEPRWLAAAVVLALYAWLAFNPAFDRDWPAHAPCLDPSGAPDLRLSPEQLSRIGPLPSYAALSRVSARDAAAACASGAVWAEWSGLQHDPALNATTRERLEDFDVVLAPLRLLLVRAVGDARSCEGRALRAFRAEFDTLFVWDTVTAVDSDEHAMDLETARLAIAVDRDPRAPLVLPHDECGRKQREAQDMSAAWEHAEREFASHPLYRWDVRKLTRVHATVTAHTPDRHPGGECVEPPRRRTPSLCVPPRREEMAGAIDRFGDWLRSRRGRNTHPLIAAADAHAKFAHIHARDQAHGRTARVVLNAALVQSGLLPVVIGADRHLRDAYAAAMEERCAATRDHNALYLVLIDAQVHALEHFTELMRSCH